jgi:shikimate dehydrogenase
MQFTGATRVIGLIADPIAQARAPGMLNALMESRGLLGPCMMVPFHFSPAALPGFIASLKSMQNLMGCMVSMPYKATVAEYLDALTPEGRLVGAVNVIRRDADGRLTGTAMDGEGMVGGLKKAGHRIDGAACLLAGAGGAAAAIAFALAKHGCKSLAIVNRTAEKAEALAKRVRAAFPAVRATAGIDPIARFDIAVNATSPGMQPGDALPFDPAVIQRSSLVAECVIAPEMTASLKTAQSLGRAIHIGVPMLAAQLETMLEFMNIKHATAIPN